MTQNIKLKKAPHFDKQVAQTTPFNDWLVLVGEKAHFAYYDKKEAGKADEWQFIRDSFHYPLDRHPVILDSKSFDEIDRLLLAPNEQTSIKFFQVGNIPTLAKDREDLKVRIMMNLAKNNAKAVAVEWLDSALQGENLADEIAKIRQGSHTVAEILSQKAPEIDLESDRPKETDKRSPFVEIRKLGGIRGLYRIVPKYHPDLGKWIESEEQWLADPVDVIGIGRSETEDFIVLQWQPENSSQHIIESLPLRELGEREGWKMLKDRGLNLTSRNNLRNELADYLQNLNKGNRQLWKITNATGWQNGAYILPNGEVIGEPDTPVRFRSQSATSSGYDIKGTIETWRNKVANYLLGNPSQMLGVAVAFSAPMIALLKAESFGVHLFEDSGRGKSTVADIANSIYGNAEKIALTWDTTHVGITNEAAARNDGFLTIDEIGQGRAKETEKIAYTLFNNVGRIRGKKDGGNHEILRWRVTALSFGEKDLETHLAEKGIQINAGQLVRLLNVPFETAKCYHGLKDGKAHADYLKQASKENYGIVGREWVKFLAENSQIVLDTYSRIKAKWLERPPEDADPQVFRVAGRFAILETALHLSATFTGWEMEECSEAMLHCFNQWVNIFGFQSKKEQQIIEQVNGWLLSNAEGRFIAFPFDDKQPKVGNIAGYRVMLSSDNDREHFYVYPKAFEEAIVGHQKEQASHILEINGMLKRGGEKGRYMVKLPHKIDPKRTRCYLLFPVIENDDPTDN